jgi:hypothetical protein
VEKKKEDRVGGTAIAKARTERAPQGLDGHGARRLHGGTAAARGFSMYIEAKLGVRRRAFEGPTHNASRQLSRLGPLTMGLPIL